MAYNDRSLTGAEDAKINKVGTLPLRTSQTGGGGEDRQVNQVLNTVKQVMGEKRELSPLP